MQIFWQNKSANKSLFLPEAAMEFAQYQDRLRRSNSEKNCEFTSGGNLLHLINGGQLTPDLIDLLSETSDKIRRLSREQHTADALRTLFTHKRAMLYVT